jgi:glycosyltransferase involved in cell wall biosynthesis
VRVAYVSPYPPARDGIGDYTAALAAATRDAGHQVAVVAARTGAGAPPEVIGGLGDAGRLRAFAPDVVHVQFGVAAFGTRTPALFPLLRRVRATGARLVVTAHDVTRDTALTRAPGRALYRALARHADLVLVHTPAARDAMAALAGPATPVIVVPHHRRPPPAPTTDAAALRARHGIGDAPVLLALGFVHPDKGLDDLVAALARLPRGAAHLVVAGGVRRRQGAFRAFELADRRHLARVRDQARRAGLMPWVHWTGYVPEGEIAPWLDAADAAVLPYRRIEQSGVGSLAAALGVPVLASDAGSLAAEYGDPAWSFPAGDRKALAALLARFLAARDQVAPRRGARDAAGADIDDVAARTLAAYAAAPGGAAEGRSAAPLA